MAATPPAASAARTAASVEDFPVPMPPVTAITTGSVGAAARLATAARAAGGTLTATAAAQPAVW